MSMFDLSHLGAELNAARRTRHPQSPSHSHSPSPSLPPGPSTSNRVIPVLDHDDQRPLPELSTSISSTSSSINTDPDIEIDDVHNNPRIDLKSGNGNDKEELEKPYPLCLLCLARPPSAVLLPCCHLNLCYLCAPLLIHRSTSLSTPSTQSSSSPIPITERTSISDECTNTPFNVRLMRATANHPKSRILAMGGYRPPEEGKVNGEVRGTDLTSFPDGPDPNLQENMGMIIDLDCSDNREDHGRIRLGGMQSKESGAKCLVCREGVKGWLRVYTG
ncbi:uncharacterized protein IL334_007841 [Kwoniella shivajii]|uniref:RING-type domain-containing protein n=1 Tax=Kwoniella shivajii TaxID=564305 RepID=A0ABZ1DDP9_9TREE|nr:hypothetical protein IL334_007841 [Kwoniella shivajii]